MNIRVSAQRTRDRHQAGGADILVCPAGRRAGFSLLELLIVIGLIAFLSAAVAIIVPRVANASKVASTRSTIKKVDEFLNDRINGFRRYIQTQDQIAGAGIPSYVDPGTLSQVNGNLPLAKILAVKRLFKTSFPQSFSELTSAPAYNSSTHNIKTESAACLYLILTQAAVFDTEPPSAADLKGFDVADTDNDGLLEVVDAWGHPVRFYRWPTRLIRASNPPTTAQSITTPGFGTGVYAITIQPNYPPGSPMTGLSARLLNSTLVLPSLSATAPSIIAAPIGTPAEINTPIYADLAKDADDPTGLIQSVVNQTTPSFTATYFEQTFHTPDTYWTPLIVSMGTDGDQGSDQYADLGLGLFEPYDRTNFGYLCQPRTDLGLPTNGTLGLNALYDNITNHQQ